MREILFKLLEKWLEIILAFKRRQYDEEARDIMSKKAIDQVLSDLKQEMVKGVLAVDELTNVLKTTKLGKGHNFCNGTDYDLFLKDWKVRKEEITLLAHSIHEAQVKKLE
jgi:secreted Zn-dependent insulinase-like peptidase